MKEIPLTRGKVALVDDEDYERLSQVKWTALQNGDRWYAYRKDYSQSPPVTIKMHREILHVPDELVVDHVDGDGLNNQKVNLRACSQAQNTYNSKPRKGMSRFKGVTREKKRRKWTAQISAGGKNRFLGTYELEEDAARAYDKAALEAFGEFAWLNFGETVNG